MSSLHATQHPRPCRARAPAARITAGALIASGTFIVDAHLDRPSFMMPIVEAADCARRLVGGGDHIPAGHEVNEDERYPDLITLTVGGENATIVNLITSCFDKVKDHDFTGANTCAAAILGNSSLWTNLSLNLTTILQQYRVLMAGPSSSWPSPAIRTPTRRRWRRG